MQVLMVCIFVFNTGVDSATCEHACIWCKCPTGVRHDMDRPWSLTDTNLGARTIEENEQLSKEPRSKKRFNVSRAPLFPTIPLTNVVIDNLHLFLQVLFVFLLMNLSDKMQLLQLRNLQALSIFPNTSIARG